MKETENRITAPRLWTVMTRSHRALSLLAEQSIANAGLCLTDFAALEALLHKGPLTISEIQDKVLLASGSMTAAIDRLEKLGLVVRKATTKDRRARIVELTREGRRVASECFEKHARDLGALMSVLSEKEMEQLYVSLKKLGLHAAEKLGERRASEWRKRVVASRLQTNRVTAGSGEFDNEAG
jgi:MarR family transcriptional regulator, 2-MHQ and catechol-resistance regulon repressor